MAKHDDYERRPEAEPGEPGDREQQWRRFDEDEEFRGRPGALDRRWGYGSRLAPGYRGGPATESSEFEAPDPYNAPGYWAGQEDRGSAGPYAGMGPVGYRRSDERIYEDVCDRLTQHAEIDASDIHVQVEGGEVTLNGTVDDRRVKRLVEANVDLVRGVVDVHNRLKMRRPPTQEEIGREKVARKMADRFPGGPVPTGSAGFDEPKRNVEE